METILGTILNFLQKEKKKMAKINVKSQRLSCDANRELLEFNYYVDTGECSIDVKDAVCDIEYGGFFGRFKKAWKVLTSKPIYYTGLYVSNPLRAKYFFQRCIDLIDEQQKEHPYDDEINAYY